MTICALSRTPAAEGDAVGRFSLLDHLKPQFLGHYKLLIVSLNAINYPYYVV